MRQLLTRSARALVGMATFAAAAACGPDVPVAPRTTSGLPAARPPESAVPAGVVAQRVASGLGGDSLLADMQRELIAHGATARAAEFDAVRREIRARHAHDAAPPIPIDGAEFRLGAPQTGDRPPANVAMQEGAIADVRKQKTRVIMGYRSAAVIAEMEFRGLIGEQRIRVGLHPLVPGSGLTDQEFNRNGQQPGNPFTYREMTTTFNLALSRDCGYGVDAATTHFARMGGGDALGMPVVLGNDEAGSADDGKQPECQVAVSSCPGDLATGSPTRTLVNEPLQDRGMNDGVPRDGPCNSPGSGGSGSVPILPAPAMWALTICEYTDYYDSDGNLDYSVSRGCRVEYHMI